ncbi:hypothetical protein ACFQ21_13285 [Ohtaekwangia kribbensis]|jgi:hypothetical protein|uniref:Uncharacterized protein n=1 Tax=Ohtaekwangia kribbensis TaxID=688913 RepID=A0ABW3K488_9BACT
MIERQEVLGRMKSIEEYFSNATHQLLQPEFECAHAINELLEQNEELTTTVVEDILSIYNKANAGEHHGGCGWSDYQFHLVHILELHEIKTEVNDHTKRITLKSV